MDLRDPDLRAALDRERTERLNGAPMVRYQYVDAVWNAAGEIVIPHTLPPAGADRIRWTVVACNAPVVPYHNAAGAPWTDTAIVLTADAALAARLLLSLEPQTSSAV